MSSKRRTPVYLINSHFSTTSTGVQTYVHYLWEHFRDDDEFEYHVIAGGFQSDHPRLHSAGTVQGPKLYRAVVDKAREVLASAPRPLLVHSNNGWITHPLISNDYPLIAQLNDYENADIVRRFKFHFIDVSPRRWLMLVARAWHERIALRKQFMTIANSDYTLNRCCQFYRVRPSRIKTIYKAVDCGYFQRPDDLPPDPAGRTRGQMRLLFVGSDWRRKGLRHLINVMPQLPKDIHLVVASISKEEFEKHFGKKVDRMGIRQQLKVPGYIDRECLPALYWHSDVFAFPSTAEGLGVAILEAMASGLPVIAGNAGGMPEIINRPNLGLLVDPGDEDGLREAILKLYGDPTLRKDLSEAGVKRAKDFSVRIMLDGIRATYHEAIRQFYG